MKKGDFYYDKEKRGIGVVLSKDKKKIIRNTYFEIDSLDIYRDKSFLTLKQITCDENVLDRRRFIKIKKSEARNLFKQIKYRFAKEITAVNLGKKKEIGDIHLTPTEHGIRLFINHNIGENLSPALGKIKPVTCKMSVEESIIELCDNCKHMSEDNYNNIFCKKDHFYYCDEKDKRYKNAGVIMSCKDYEKENKKNGL